MKALYTFTKKNLIKNKNRTIVSIIGVVLTCVLMFGLGLGFSTIREMMIQEEYLLSGKAHVTYTKLPFSSYQTILNDKDVDKVEYTRELDYDLYEYDDLEYAVQIYDRNGYQLNDFALDSGKYPENENELLVPILFAHKLGKNINDEIILNEKTYKIVGLIKEKGSFTSVELEVVSVFTNTKKLSKEEEVNFLVTFKNTKNIYKKIINLSTKLDLKPDFTGAKLGHEHETIHEDLLELYGQIRHYGKFAIMFLCLLLLLTVLAISSMIVIYNAFAISVTERKKTLGILSSIGATRWQLLGSVMLEATMIALIAIPLGFFLSIGGMQLLLTFINYIMRNVNSYHYVVSIYPFFLLVPFFFILVSIYLSAFFPAMRAFEVTPMEAIRQNQDIQFKKRLWISKVIQKIFGFEASIAYKNSKRNKKKYRIPILSLFISIVLFITCSTFIQYGLSFVGNKAKNTEQADVMIGVIGKKDRVENFYFDLIKDCEITSHQYYHPNYGTFESDEKPVLEDTYEFVGTPNFFHMTVLRDSDYQEYLKKIGKNKAKPILINYAGWDIYEEGTFELLEHKESKIYKNLKDLNLNLEIKELDNHRNENIVTGYITDFYETSQLPDVLKTYAPSLTIVLSESMYQSYFPTLKDKWLYVIYLDTKDSVKIDQNIKQIEKDYHDIHISYVNPAYEVYKINKQIFLYQLLLYVLIGFILVIAITSVFNTIYTSIKLRRKEFAILRSVGMTTHGFHKMIFFESLLFGVKSLSYGIFVSLGIIWLIFGIFHIIPTHPNEPVPSVPFPAVYILITVIGIMIIVLLAMFYSIQKIKKENIIDVIKEDSF